MKAREAGRNSEQMLKPLEVCWQTMVHFPGALEENGMRPATCPSELVMFSCHQTPAQPSESRADDTAVLCDDGNHEKSIHVRTSVGTQKKHRDLLTWSTRTACCKNSTFLGRYRIFTKFLLDSRPAAPRQEPFTSVFFGGQTFPPPWPCVSYTPLHR